MDPTIINSITTLLSVLFLLAGSIKVFGWHKVIFETQLKFFEKYGLNRSIMRVIGVVELLCAFAIWDSGYIGITGASTLLLLSVGAIYCHFKFDTWREGIPAMMTLALSAAILCAKAIAILG